MKPVFLSALIAVVMGGAPAEARVPRWKKVVINARSEFEGVAVADFNGDRRPDVFSGDSWYEAPRWVRHKVRDVAPVGTYFEDMGDLALDVNGDGNVDIVTCTFWAHDLTWLQHPGDATAPWITHRFDHQHWNETCRLADVNGDGRLDLLPNSITALVWFEIDTQRPEVEWKQHVVGDQASGHGVGFGDIDGDGRVDLIGPKGWYQQPAGDTSGPWALHRDFDLGKAGILILARDVDGDGLTDLVWGMGHDYGLGWLRQKKGADGVRTWERLEIDPTLAEVHTLIWADLDGHPDRPAAAPALIAGKRIYAHEVEPGATDAPGIYAFRFDRGAGRWNKEVVYEGAAPVRPPARREDRHAQKDFLPGTAGTGVQLEARDMDGDGDLDLVCPGKTGLYLFINGGREVRK